MSGKGQLTITAEKARELCYESKLADHIPHIEQRIIAAAERGETHVDLGLWTETCKHLQKRLEDSGFAVVASDERCYGSDKKATRLKVSW